MAKKLYYKIGEACKRLDIQPYVLRYWETEFPLLAPNKSTSGQRVYSEQDLRVIQRIKELLYEEGYTIAGAKKKLEKEDLSTLGEVRQASTKKDAGESAPAASESKKPASKAQPASKAKAEAKPAPKKKAAPEPSSDAEAKLRRGVRSALKDARGILELLDS